MFWHRKIYFSGEALIPFAVAILVLVASWFLEQGTIVSRDVAWLTLAARRLMEGGVYGRDVMEISPPAGVWIYSPAIILTKSGVALAPAIKFYLASLLALHTLVCLCLVPKSSGWSVRSAVIVGALLVPVLSDSEFGQKDELAFLLEVPLLGLILRRVLYGGQDIILPFKIAIGVLAGIGSVIKPGLAVAFPILWLMVRDVEILVEPAIVSALLTGLVGALSAWNSHWWDLARLYARSWTALNNPEWQVCLALLPTLMLGGVLLRILSQLGKTAIVVAWVFGMALAGALSLTLAQHKFWEYHLLPARLLTAWIGVTLWVMARHGTPKAVFRDRALASIVIALVFLQEPGIFIERQKYSESNFLQPGNSVSGLYSALIDLSPTDHWVLLDSGIGSVYTAPEAKSTEHIGGFPIAIYVSPQWGSRYAHLWQLPWIVTTLSDRNATPYDREKALTLRANLFADLAADLDRYHPALIAIPSGLSHQGITDPFDLVSFLFSDNGLAARMRRDYHLSPGVQTGFAIFVRNVRA